MRPILCGVETEYGLYVEGRGAEDQIDDSADLLKGYPGPGFAGWNYGHERPRADLRGFSVDRLAEDPEDRKFDRARNRTHDRDLRNDRVLPNGARFYNDHGHPEYATPETLCLRDLAEYDRLGQDVVLQAGRAFAQATGRAVKLYKNNTDFHKASYGTHESYLTKREFGFQRLFDAVTPMLVARQILTGAGKVGAEHGSACAYQISQRADFFVEAANLETLYRRPVFNTRDEPHADPRKWIRLHVISCDANMMPVCTARRVGLVKLALALLEAGEAPVWKLADPVRTFETISKDDSYAFKVPLTGGSWTTAQEIIESYLAAAENVLEADPDVEWLVQDCRLCLSMLREDFTAFSRRVDWAAKRRVLEMVMAEEGLEWRNRDLISYDLEYHNVDPDEGLFYGWDHMGEVDDVELPDLATPKTRAYARGLAVSRFSEALVDACWQTLTFEVDGKEIEIDLPPDAVYPAELDGAANVGTFIEMLRGVN
jgi:Pup amidohydrolase